MPQGFLQSPNSDHGSALHSDYPIVPTRLDQLTVEAGWHKYSSDDSLVELESISRNQRDRRGNHPLRNISKQVQGIAIASFADHCGRPKSRPDVEDNKDPDRLLPASPHDRLDHMGLMFREGESYSSIIEPATLGCCPFKLAMHRIPGDPHGSDDGGFVIC